MTSHSVTDFFFRLRWPHGFRCPRCAYHEYYLIQSRSLPLYQCRLCGKQTSLTAGTLMHKSRTPLEKWMAAFDTLASVAGMCATKLAAAIGVTYKVAWTMMSKFRIAMGEAEREHKLEGTVFTGLRILAPKYILMFFPARHYRVERVVALSASVDTTGRPTAIKLHMVQSQDLKPGMKVATEEGRERLIAQAAAGHSNAQWLHEWPRFPGLLKACFAEARQWFVEVFNGIGTKYLQRYLDEYCFRWNTLARGANLRTAWLHLCFGQPQSANLQQAA